CGHAARADQREDEAVHLLADDVILLAELDHLGELALELLAALAQRQDLPLADRNRAPAVGMRDEHVGDDLRVMLEKLGVFLQVRGNVVGLHHVPCSSFDVVVQSGSSMAPSNTVTAGPVISTGWPAPDHTITRSPPRVETLT